MTSYPYTQSNNNLKSFIEKIPGVGVPPKVSKEWLESVGFTAVNDRSIPRILQFIGLVDSSWQPTPKWTQFRDSSDSGKVLADAIRTGYATLFDVHATADQLNVGDLKNFFRSKTNSGATTVNRITNTFKTLCSLADFSQKAEGEASSEERVDAKPAMKGPRQQQGSSQPFAPTLHINIQVHISSDSGPDQIDQIFESMAKHLYSKATDAP